jgi:hypothetical protein
MKVKRYLKAILVSVTVFAGVTVDAGTSALGISGIVKEKPSGKTLPGWPEGAYTDNRRIPEARLVSGHADQGGVYNLLAPNVPSDLEVLWILNDGSSGEADPVSVSLPNPIPSQYAATAEDLIVTLRTNALAERASAVSYTAAVVEDQAVRVSLTLVQFDQAHETVIRKAGLVVVTEYQRNPEAKPPYSYFWSDVRNKVKGWDYRHEKIISIASQLTNDLEAKTLKDPDPSSKAYAKSTGAQAPLPFAIGMQDGRPFSFARLWENWKDPEFAD